MTNHQSHDDQQTRHTNQLGQLFFGNIFAPRAVVTLDDIEIVVARVRDHLPGGVRKRHRVLLEFRSEVRNLEDTKTRVNNWFKKPRWGKRGFSVGTIGYTIKKGFVMPKGCTAPCSHRGRKKAQGRGTNRRVLPAIPMRPSGHSSAEKPQA